MISSFRRYRGRFAIVAVIFLLASSSIAAPSRRPVVDNVEFQALPLERSQQNHLLVRALINDKPARLVVDTGAPVSAIAVNRRKHFGLAPIPVKSKLPARLRINGGYNSLAIVRHFKLGMLGLLNEPVVLIDMSSSHRAAKAVDEEPVDGILGADILFPTSALVDCQTQTLILKLDPRLPGAVPGYDFRGLRSVPLHVSKNNNLYVDGNINGTAAKLMVDTGAFATLMHQSFIRDMKLPLRKTRYSSAGVNLSERGLQLATINRLSIGSVLFRKKEVGVMDLEGLIHGGMLNGTPPVAGLLGSEILRRHHGIIDFGTLTLYLKR